MAPGSEVSAQAEERAEERPVDLLLPPPPPRPARREEQSPDEERRRKSREKLRGLLREGRLDDREVEVEITPVAHPPLTLLQPPEGMEGPDVDFTALLQQMTPRQKKRRTVKVPEAKRLLIDEELKRLVDQEDTVNEALDRVENHGILFIDGLGRRLVANLADDRLNTRQLERYGSLGLCDVPGIVARLKAPPGGLTIILNGTVVLENMSVHALCSWQAAEVELVEFGQTVCRDATRTLVDMLNVWCTRFNEHPDRSPGALRAAREARNDGGRMGTQRRGGPFVVIWERR